MNSNISINTWNTICNISSYIVIKISTFIIKNKLLTFFIIFSSYHNLPLNKNVYLKLPLHSNESIKPSSLYTPFFGLLHRTTSVSLLCEDFARAPP